MGSRGGTRMRRRYEAKRRGQALGLAAAMAACGGPPADGQVSPPPDDARGLLHVYEIAPEQVQQAREAGFIEVSGNGAVTVPPDRAAVAFAVETRAAAASDAAGANADAMDAVLGAVRRAGFPGLEIETFGYSLRPEYSSAPNQRTRDIVAYTALNNVRATTSDVEEVGRIIDVAIAAGANRVASISFYASDTEDAEAEALARAVEDARGQAEVIARTLGYRLGPPLEVRGGHQRPVPLLQAPALVRALEVQAAPTPIEAGEQSVTATVTVRFALGPEGDG